MIISLALAAASAYLGWKVTIEKPKAGDNRSDWERLITQLDVKETVKADLDMAASLYECRKKDADWHVI